MLNWRITTGNMRVDRYLDYQCQRARLSNSSEHWKDFGWALLQLVKKGTVKPNDEPAFEALLVLQKKHHELGDMVADILLLLAEAYGAQKNFVEMEKRMLEVATSSEEYPKRFFDLLDTLLGERSEACWELHQLALDHALEEVVEGNMVWNMAETVIIRARKHREQRLDYLLDHEMMVRLEPLGQYVFESVLNLPDNKVHQALLRWRYAYSSHGVEIPDSIKKAYNDAKEQGYTGFESLPTIVQPESESRDAADDAGEEQAPETDEPMPEPPTIAKAEEAKATETTEPAPEP